MKYKLCSVLLSVLLLVHAVGAPALAQSADPAAPDEYGVEEQSETDGGSWELDIPEQDGEETPEPELGEEAQGPESDEEDEAGSQPDNAHTSAGGIRPTRSLMLTINYVAVGAQFKLNDPEYVTEVIHYGEAPVNVSTQCFFSDSPYCAFNGYYLDERCTQRYEPGTPLYEDTTIYAHFVPGFMGASYELYDPDGRIVPKDTGYIIPGRPYTMRFFVTEYEPDRDYIMKNFWIGFSPMFPDDSFILLETNLASYMGELHIGLLPPPFDHLPETTWWLVWNGNRFTDEDSSLVLMLEEAPDVNTMFQFRIGFEDADPGPSGVVTTSYGGYLTGQYDVIYQITSDDNPSDVNYPQTRHYAGSSFEVFHPTTS